MIADAELLARYAEENDQAAFTELVERRIDLVYSVATRRCGGDRHLAEDVTQRVFTALARKAAALSRHAALSGWLYRSARFAAADVVRAERRRRTREQEAHRMDEPSTDPTPNADRLRPLLDAALTELSAADRDAVALRFFEQRTFAEIGAALRLSEEAARKRIDRALDKVRTRLVRHGVTSTAAALAVALEQQGTLAAPAGLAASVAETAIGTATTAGVVSFTNIVLWQAAAAAAIALVGSGIVMVQGRANTALQQEIVALQQKVSAIEPLRAENAQLARAAAEAGAWRNDDAEFARLSQEVAALQRSRKASTTAPAPGRKMPLRGDEPVRMRMPDADLTTILQALELYTGKKIARDPSIARRRVSVSMAIGPVPVSEAMAYVKNELLAKAQIEIVDGPDGQLLARAAKR